MKQFGHGLWLSIEREAMSRAGSPPLTFDRIKATMSQGGAHETPDNKTISAHMAGEGVPQGKTRLAYEKFWRKHAHATPISVLVRLVDIDDAQHHLDLIGDMRQRSLDKMVKASEKSKLVIRWHEYVRALELRLVHLERLITYGMPTIEELYQCYRCHYRLADALYEGQHAGLALPNGLTAGEIETAVRQHYALAWQRANDALKLADRELLRLDIEVAALATKEKARSTDGEQASNLSVAVSGMRIMRDLFVLGCAAAAENRLSLALKVKEPDAKDVAEWRDRLWSTSRSGQSELDANKPAEKRRETALATLSAVFTGMNAAFEDHCALDFARDRIAFVAAMFVLVGTEKRAKNAREELDASLRVLREAIHDSGGGQPETTKEQARLLGIPTIENVMRNGIISEEEIKHVLAHS